jgi:biotin synthase
MNKFQSSAESVITRQEAIDILDGAFTLPKVLDMAYTERTKYFGNKVRIHILDNVKNGHCPEDCGYCAQRKNANSGVQNYSLKSLEEIYEDAIQAKENGAYRFCIVSSGTGPNDNYVDTISPLIEKITSELGLRVCLSAGLLNKEKAQKLKESGLERYNHNLNTSAEHYSEICTTHTYQSRVETLRLVQEAGMGSCSGIIVGMGEASSDIVDVALEIKGLKIVSIPVNFFIPIAGHAIKQPSQLTPEMCLRILSVFRLINPDSEIRMAAGREGHLRGMQSMGLFPANSLFASGYLNVKGSDMEVTVQMIKDAGFEPEMDSNQPFQYNSSEVGYSEKTIKELYKYNA